MRGFPYFDEAASRETRGNNDFQQRNDEMVALPCRAYRHYFPETVQCNNRIYHLYFQEKSQVPLLLCISIMFEFQNDFSI